MSENLKAFLEAAKDDPELRSKLSTMVLEELVAAAKEKGIELSEEDFHAPSAEVSEDELSNAAGGGGGGCFMLGGGGGTDDKDGKTYGCACVFYGQGGDGSYDDFNCSCVFLGAGTDWNNEPIIIC